MAENKSQTSTWLTAAYLKYKLDCQLQSGAIVCIIRKGPFVRHSLDMFEQGKGDSFAGKIIIRI